MAVTIRHVSVLLRNEFQANSLSTNSAQPSALGSTAGQTPFMSTVTLDDATTSVGDATGERLRQ